MSNAENDGGYGNSSAAREKKGTSMGMIIVFKYMLCWKGNILN